LVSHSKKKKRRTVAFKDRLQWEYWTQEGESNRRMEKWYSSWNSTVIKLRPMRQAPWRRWEKRNFYFQMSLWEETTWGRRGRGRWEGKIKIQRAQKSVNVEHSLVLTGIFEFKPASQFVERYHRRMSCALNMEILIANSFYKFGK
jgi:hypothetical protein